MKIRLQNILLKCLTLAALLLVAVDGWGWTGSDPAWSPWAGSIPQNNTPYYLFSKTQNKFLKDNNLGWGIYGDTENVMWNLSNFYQETKDRINYTLTSTRNYNFILYVESNVIYPYTNKTNWAPQDYNAVLATEKGDNGYYTIFRAHKHEYGGWPTRFADRNVESQSGGNGLKMKKESSPEWLFVTDDEYSNATTQCYLYNIATGQFLSFQSNGSKVKTYVTNDPTQATLVTILLKYVNGDDKKSFIRASINQTDYYMYQSSGDNDEYTLGDKYFTLVSKTIGSSTGYQLKLKNGDDKDRFACAGYGNFLENRSFSELYFPKDASEDPNSLWLFISQDEYNSTLKSKLAPVHVPITYDNYRFFDGEITTRKSGRWDDDTNKRVWLTNENDTFDIHFDGIPDTLFFRHKPKSDKSIYNERHFTVLESSDGFLWSAPIFEDTHNDSDDKKIKSDTVLLEPTTRYVRFCISGCNGINANNTGGCFYNIRVSELSMFETNKSVINFGKHGKNDGIFEEYVAFSHANAADTVRLSISGEDAAAFVVEPTKIVAGKDIIHTDYVKVSYVGTNVKTHNATLTFNDGTPKLNITLTGQRIDNHVPIFTWNPEELPYYYDDSIPRVFSSNTSKDLAPINISNGSTTAIAELQERADGSYSLVIHSKPEIEQTCSITVSQAGNDTIEPVNKTYIFTPREKPTLQVPFKLTKADFDYAVSKAHYKVPVKDQRPRLKWVDEEADKENNDAAWYEEGGEFMRLGFSSTLSSDAWNDWSDKYIYFEFAGQPDSLFFKYTTFTLATGPDWYVLESATGVGDPMTWSKAWHVSTNTSKDFQTEYKQAAIALKPSTRFICLCYSGNYCGRFQDIRVTAYDGIFYLKDGGTGKYLSRGGDEGKDHVFDDYGIAVRKTRETADNTSIDICVQYMDSYWYDGTKIPLTATSVASPVWESLSDHAEQMQALKDQQAITAANEFNESVPSLAILRQLLRDNDYGKEEIDLSTIYAKAEPQELYESLSEPDALPVCSLRVKEGLYHLSLKAFNRMMDNANNYAAYLHGYDNSVTYVYAKNGKNEQHTQLYSVYSTSEIADYNPSPKEGDWADYSPRYGIYYPNGKTAAQTAFEDNNRYENDVFIYVRPDGNEDNKGLLEFGLRAPSNGKCMNWVCWQDFTLKRYFRKEFVFDNGDGSEDPENSEGSGDNKWSNGKNWVYQGHRGKVPQSIHKVEIQDSVSVEGNQGAYQITYTPKGYITIEPTASLMVREGGFKGTPAKPIVIKADSTNALTKGQTGSLKLYPGLVAPQAVVQFYSTISNEPENTDWDWQYIGSPITQESSVNNEQIFYNCWLYQHDTESDSWTTAGNWNKMEPFRAYAFTRNSGKPSQYGRPSTGPMFLYSGQLNAPVPDTIALKYGSETRAENHIANSWTAPIDLRNFEKEDFVNAEPTIYIYTIAGKGNVESKAIFTIKYTGDSVLSSMQGFFVKATSAESPKLILDYERLIWNGRTVNAPLKAPSRLGRNGEETDLTARVCVHLLSADSIPDRIFLLEKEGEGFSRSYTEGYDAPKYMVDGLPCIYTYETSGPHLAVNATDSLLGTYLAINTNASQTYTLSFDKVVGEGLGLRDLVTDTVVPIADGVQYTFTAVPNQKHQLRFVVDEYIAPEIGQGGTGLEQQSGGILMRQDGQILSVTGAPANASLRIYDAAGKLVWNEAFHYAIAIDMSVLPSGVYVATVDNTKLKVLR